MMLVTTMATQAIAVVESRILWHEEALSKAEELNQLMTNDRFISESYGSMRLAQGLFQLLQ